MSLATEIIRYLAWLRAQERYDEEVGFHWWPFHISGNPVIHSDDATLFPCTCTCGAKLIAARLGGQVMGYAEGENPEAMAGRGISMDHNIGHDFAIVGSFLVDYWLMQMDGVPAFGLLHLDHDAAQIRRLYGPESAWKIVYPKNWLAQPAENLKPLSVT